MLQHIRTILQNNISQSLQKLQVAILPKDIILYHTKPDFEGDFTFNVFPYIKQTNTKPQALAHHIGNELLAQKYVEKFNVINGFLNFVILDSYWIESINVLINNPLQYYFNNNIRTIVIEFCGPNTNKPLHLGHLRTIFLGQSMSNILKVGGHNVSNVNIFNDRGIAISKSMLAWQKCFASETPETLGMKSDHFVGLCYVTFDMAMKKESEALKIEQKETTWYKEAQTMVISWENDDENIRTQWRQMNQWFYDGFYTSIQPLNIHFDKHYYESETYSYGRELVKNGLLKKQFAQKNNGAIVADLTEFGLDEKVLLRSDGTSVYLTQDLGTNNVRHNEFQADQYIYVVANEQNYHFKILAKCLVKLEKSYADSIFHLSYGLVELPNGRMKSREGTVVDADDLMTEMTKTARDYIHSLGKLAHLDSELLLDIQQKIGLAALKYHVLKVQPTKNMIFNPEESIDFIGHTGPFILYAYVRIQSLLLKSQKLEHTATNHNQKYFALHTSERKLIILLNELDVMVTESIAQYDPSIIANYCYQIAKSFNQFYHDCPILHSEFVAFRLDLSQLTANVLRQTLEWLGIDVVEQM